MALDPLIQLAELALHYSVRVCTAMPPLFAFVAVLAALAWWIRPNYVPDSVPGPPRHWLLGVTFSEQDTSFVSGASEPFSWSRWPTLSRILSEQVNYQTWGGPSLNIGFGGAFFNVVSPNCMQYILRDHADNFIKGKLTRSFGELMGNGNFAFNTDGEIWKFHRKMAVSVLSRDTVKQGSVLLLEKLQQADRLIHRKILKQNNNTNGQDNGSNSGDGVVTGETTLDFQEFVSRLVLDVFLQLGFGVELNSWQDDGCNNNSSSIHEQNGRDFVHALDELQYLIHCRFNDLLWEVKQRFAIGKREQRVTQLTKILDEFAYAVIQDITDKMKQQEEEEQKEKEAVSDNKTNTDDRRNHEDNDSTSTKAKKNRHTNIVRQYLQVCKEQNQPAPTHQDLRDLIIGFTVAGRDSTAAGLTWTLYELIKHPAVVDRIREEVHQVCGRDQQPLTLELLRHMPFLHWTVLEALRLHPPFPEHFRFAVKDDVLPDGTHIPAGALVMFSVCTINHSSAVWQDPEVFNPDRYCSKEPSPFQFTTFGGGPRACPGRALSLMEIKMTLAYLLPRFDFTDAGNHNGDYHWTLVMAMKGGFPVRIKRRDSPV